MSPGPAILSARDRGARRTPGARARVTGRAIVLGALVVALLLAAVYPLQTYLAQRDRIDLLRQQTTQLQLENRRLANRIEQLRDPTYLERYARECLGMIRPGETAVVIVPDVGEPDSRAC
jgi:cell division protein FtsB